MSKKTNIKRVQRAEAKAMRANKQDERVLRKPSYKRSGRINVRYTDGE